MENPTRLLLVEDDARLARLVREYLEREGFTVDVLHDGTSAVSRILDDPPDLVLLDQMLPGLDGLQVLQRVRQDYPGPVVMLTARTGEVDQIVGLEMGADDYVSKPASPRLLLARIKAQLRRASARTGVTRWEDAGVVVDAAAREARVGDRAVDLTSAEFDLLWALVEHAGRPVSRDALLRQLRGIAYDGVDRSVDVRVSAVRRKLREAGAGERIETVRGVGYQFVTPPRG